MDKIAISNFYSWTRHRAIKNIYGLVENARYEAHKATGKYRIGCILANANGQIISRGFNKYKSHPIQADFAKRSGYEQKIYLHAEIDTLIKYKRIIEFEGATLCVVRITKSGSLAMSKPCPTCMFAILESNYISNIIYTDTNNINIISNI